MSMGLITIRMPTGVGKDQHARVTSPFSAKDLIKDTVPTGYRYWDSDLRSWMVDELFVQDLVVELHRCGYEVQVLGKPIERQQAVSSVGWAAGTFATCMTRDQVESMRKALLRVHHPDKGGSAAMVEEINAAAEKRRKQVY